MTITLPYAPSANNYRVPIKLGKFVRLILSKEARTYFAKAEAIIKAAQLTPLEGPVRLDFAVYRPRRSGDLTNRLKIAEDCLKGHAYHDDEQVEHVTARRFEDKLNPRIEITVSKI